MKSKKRTDLKQVNRAYTQKHGVLRQIMLVKDYSSLTLGKKINLCQPTIDKFCAYPGKMNAEVRNKFAKELGLTIDIMDDICNGKITNIAQVIIKKRKTDKKTTLLINTEK